MNDDVLRGATQSGDESFIPLAEAARLARLSRRKLTSWVHAGVVTPSLEVIDAGMQTAKGFTLADVGYLHLLEHLRKADVPLRDAVESLNHLMRRFGAPGPHWRDGSIIVHGKRVIAFLPDEWQSTEAIPGSEGAGQRLAREILGELLDDDVSLESILIPSKYIDTIELNPRKEGGLPVIRGTRLRTSMISRLADKVGPDAVVRDYYDHITREAVELCQEFEAEMDLAA